MIPAGACRQPGEQKHSTRILVRLTPARRAASALPPMA